MTQQCLDNEVTSPCFYIQLIAQCHGSIGLMWPCFTNPEPLILEVDTVLARPSPQVCHHTILYRFQSSKQGLCLLEYLSWLFVCHSPQLTANTASGEKISTGIASTSNLIWAMMVIDLYCLISHGWFPDHTNTGIVLQKKRKKRGRKRERKKKDKTPSFSADTHPHTAAPIS